MAHATRLHKRYLGDSVLAFGKRLPEPEPEPEPGPGLLGDVVDGVATVADNAASGVVGLVTTVVSDVNALVAPPKQTSSAASTRVSSSSVHATPTPTKPKPKPEPSASSTAASGEPSEGSSGSGSGSSGNSGGESSNGGGSGSSGGNGSSDDSNSGGTTSGSGSGSDSSGGTGSVNGDGSSVNSSNSNSGPDASSININVNGGSNPSSTLQQTPGANSNASGSQISGVGTGATSSASASVTGTGTGTGNLDLVEDSVTASGSAASASAIINAVASKDSVSPSDSSLSSSAPRSTATPSGPSHSSSTTGSSSPGSGSGGGVTGNSDGSAANGSGALSPGVITAIAVACSLVLLALFVLILRKWYRTRRARRFEHWVSRPGAFTFFRAAAVSVNSEKDEKSVGGARSGSGSGLGSGTRSARSSFGTTFDQGLRPFTPDTFFEPSASSFSEFFATANTPTSLLSPSPAAAVPSVQRPENAVDRQSLLSMGSSSPSLSSSSYSSRNGHGNTSTEAMAEERADDGSGADAQYLLAPAPQASGSPGRPQLSPISVRPWSPSERWAFPKPPTTTAQSIVHYTPPSPPASHSAHVERVPASPLPPVPSPRAEHDPFADPPHHDTSTGARPVSASASASAPSASESAAGTDTDAFIGAVDYVRRPFVPTLADELAVLRGDTIRVLQSFDDGWVQIEKLSSAASDSPMAESNVVSGSGSTKNERGLIPVDCLREAGEALPAFLASRRVSSYYGGVAI